ncbi:DNA methyltransferase [Actinobacteria bacterium SCGC AG-212-D09]|nr:DNA methyltransferase [Actinobacteria bacterium SCGC AG-212-D09]
MQKLDLHSPDLTVQNIERLIEILPSVATEKLDDDGAPVRAIDFDLLRQELSDHIIEGPQERYQLDWPGKREALFAANAPIARTLRPSRDESVDFDTTRNLFIDGDNLEALKLLQESLLGKVKLIYIDPPYNTGNDLVYNDDFASSTGEYLERSGQADAEGTRLVANTDANGRFHSDWLSMMYPRLKLARNLLSDDGVVFASISEHEVDNLRKLFDSTFGEGNFIGQIAVSKGTTTGQDAGHIGSSIDFLLIYARNREEYIPHGLPLDAKDVARFSHEDARGRFSTLQFRKTGSNDRREDRPNLYYALTAPDGSEVYPIGPGGYESCWRAARAQFEAWEGADMIVWQKDPDGKYKPYVKYYLEGRTKQVSNYWDDIEGNKKATLVVKELVGKGVFSNPKPVGLIKKILYIATERDSVVLDFFSGSGTTAHAVMQLNAEDGGSRSHIQIQLPEPTPEGSAARAAGYESIADIAKARIRLAGGQILKGDTHSDWDRDVGFRALRIDTTNMTDVLRAPDHVEQSELDGLTDSVKPDRFGEDLLFQVLLDWGLDLALPIVADEIVGHPVLVVDDGALMACFSATVTADLVSAIANRQPLRAVFRDSAFATDADRVNVEQVFAEKSPSTDVKAI